MLYAGSPKNHESGTGDVRWPQQQELQKRQQQQQRQEQQQRQRQLQQQHRQLQQQQQRQPPRLSGPPPQQQNTPAFAIFDKSQWYLHQNSSFGTYPATCKKAGQPISPWHVQRQKELAQMLHDQQEKAKKQAAYDKALRAKRM